MTYIHPPFLSWPTLKGGIRLLTWVFISMLSGAQLLGAELYVAPTGDDANPGTLTSPFATVQRAQQAAAPGDTVWIRGGTYKMSEAQIAQRRRGRAYVTFLDKSGTKEQPINYWAYQGEQPVFDFSDVKLQGSGSPLFTWKAPGFT